MPQPGTPFTDDVVEAIKRHMNEDHPADCLEIVQGLGGHRDATAAGMVDMDEDGIVFSAEIAGAEVPVRVAWAEPVTERPQVRREVVRMSQQARRSLGLAPHAEH
ncbi:DUF2470 domain-containing protein [Actinomadura flavalba]|uniref:DUF2470 domain-containing protein n=1 Tax=Actinomadura flavalba TaxID=1120938 RepID=UPI00037F3D88|nr:DUF2470 domain-containing protein [Actinomadura flavalba]